MSAITIRVDEDREVPGAPYALTVEGYPLGEYNGTSFADVLRQLADEWDRFPIHNYVGVLS